MARNLQNRGIMTEPIKCFHFDHAYDSYYHGPCCFLSLPGVQNFQQLHSNSQYIKIKEQFQKGIWPETYCNSCKDIEFLNNDQTQTHLSKRQASLGQYKLIEQTTPLVPDTLYQLTADTGKLCNIQCRSCSPHLSSSWINEYNQIPTQFKMQNNSHQLDFKVWPTDPYNYKNEDFSKIRYINLLGGEPMYNTQAYGILEKLYNDTNGNCTVAFTTNGTIQFDMDQHPWLSKFKQIDLMISLDAVGLAAEFIRTGCTWSTVEYNIQQYRKMKNINVFCHATYSVLNLFEIKQLHKWCDNMKIPRTSETTYVEVSKYFWSSLDPLQVTVV